MLAGNTKIHWIDVSTQESTMGNIETLFQKYSMFAEKVDKNASKITFGNTSVSILISDMYGWTAIEEIYKENIPNINTDKFNDDSNTWVKCSLADHSFIGRGIDPGLVYNPDKISKGFHGETKYEKCCSPLSKLETLNAIGRIKRGKDENGNDIEFAKYKIEKADTPSAGYIILTKSGCYNADNIHMVDMPYVYYMI